MSVHRVLFSSTTEHWATPPEVYAALDREFDFDFDPCPLHAEFNGLAHSWAKRRVYCNPPYGRGIADWLRKVADRPQLAVYLLPARTDTAWWHDYAMKADEIRFLRGRLNYGRGEAKPDPKLRAPFPSCVLIYRP